MLLAPSQCRQAATASPQGSIATDAALFSVPVGERSTGAPQALSPAPRRAARRTSVPGERSVQAATASPRGSTASEGSTPATADPDSTVGALQAVLPAAESATATRCEVP